LFQDLALDEGFPAGGACQFLPATQAFDNRGNFVINYLVVLAFLAHDTVKFGFGHSY
jgi:hypothetical protein